MSTIFDDKYNGKRKELLLLLADNTEISKISLLMYGLTPYIKNEQDLLDGSLHEMVIANECKSYPITHILNESLFFNYEQYRFLSLIEENNKLIISAPTSFGKTLIVKEYIFAKQPNLVIYIVPTNALAYELEHSFKENQAFNCYKIFDKKKSTPIKNNTDKLLFIGTQEKYLEIKDSFNREADLFVIDEAYKLECNLNKQREYKLSLIFLEGIKSKKILLLSPNADFIGFNNYGFVQKSTNFNFVDKVFCTIDKKLFYSTLLQNSSVDKTILFCPRPKDLTEVVKAVDCLENKKRDEFLSQLENDVHPDWNVVKLFRKGILSHHGIMPKYVQNKMLRLYNDSKSEYKLLVGTNSISEGINTPTKNIFIHPDYSVKDNLMLMKNTVGRAGRLGKYPIGKIFSSINIQEYLNDSKICIKLGVSDGDQSKEISDIYDETKITNFANEFSIDLNFCKKIIEKYKLSLTKIRRIFECLKTPLKYAGSFNAARFGHHVFKEDYHEHDIYLGGHLVNASINSFYYKKNSNIPMPLRTVGDKIGYLKTKISKLHDTPNSELIDLYLNFYYSRLAYYVYPTLSVCKDIIDAYPNNLYGSNVVESVNQFIKKFNLRYLGVDNLDSYSDEEKQILLSIREYGVPINNKILNKDMILEINGELSERYSTFDIVNAVHRLSSKSKRFYDEFKNLYKKYLS